ncbi:AMP-binding protein [Mycobacterium sp. 236(2023)]|uniref:AMP-binding protein n=1 Tax=Mycobacterium sp. 236(2023) TaxID=3038163 RepID=UPI0024156B97|nr:AMP-binding protein [Mycobacterium sp. 236(2023)]MDG4667046.1 AMP-binding protein [Mycobacterium sp. 236(2023)]
MTNWLLGGAPDAVALIAGTDRRAITYSELGEAADTVAKSLAAQGLRAGDVVAVLAGNGVDFVVALLGAVGAGLTVAPLDPSLPQAGIDQRLDMLGARLVLTGQAVTATDLRPGRSPVGLIADDVLIMFTSGTTGTPKMVPWTRQALRTSVATIARTYQLSSADATVAVMPLFHGHGLVATLLTSLAVGATVLLPAAGRFSATTFWDDMAAAGATWYTAVPTIHQIVLARTESEIVPAGLRFVRSCSAPLSRDVAARMEDVLGVPVLTAYGMTEATHHITGCTPADDVTIRRGTVGTPVGTTAKTVDGEVWLSGPEIARGYLGDPALSAGAFTEGWLRTGDLGVIDDQGNLSITGRIKNIINRGGEKISPERVEQVLAGCPGVAQAAVFPVPDDVYGETVGAAVVATPGSSLTAERLVADCRDRLAKFEVPEQIRIVDELPLTAKGDVNRAALISREATSCRPGHRVRQ